MKEITEDFIYVQKDKLLIFKNLPSKKIDTRRVY